ncbi:hypothetical protein JW962_01050 [Candidatus Dojkabacteria bacterium]|nr:hypothetical protein [Candidatus Dojkabacteria bacterium]
MSIINPGTPPDPNEREGLPSSLSNAISCAAVYVSAFSRPPFSEIWKVAGVEQPEFLRDPNKNRDLLLALESTGCLTSVRTNEADEQVISVPAEIVNKHMESLGIQGSVADQIVEITLPYPVTAVINSYIDAIDDPRSVVVLAHSKTANEPAEYTRLGGSIKIPDIDILRGVGRIITINHPNEVDRPAKRASEVVLSEIRHYLTSEQAAELKAYLQDDFVTYLAEVAKVPADDPSLNPTQVMFDTYLRAIGFSYRLLAPKPPFPDQVVFFTLEGTEVAQSKRSNKSLGSIVQWLLNKISGCRYDSIRLAFPRNPGQPQVVVEILNKIKE